MSSRPLFIFIILLCALPVLGALFPRSLAFSPGISALIGLFLYRVDMKAWPRMWRDGFIIVGGICALAAISALWSLDSAFALERAGKIALVLVPGMVLLSLVRAADEEMRALFVRAFPFAALVTGGICLIDLYTQGAIYNQFFTRKSEVWNYSWLNRQVLIFVLVSLISVYAILRSQIAGQQKRVILGALGGFVMLALYRTDSQATHLLAVLAAVFWAFFPVARAKFWGALSAGFVVLVFGAPWIVRFAYVQFAPFAEQYSWLQNAYVADRLEIWDFVLRKSLENPLYGFGIEATRHIEKFETAMLYTPHDHVLHPHNFAAQMWIEFGIIGAAAAAGFIVYILKSIQGVGDMQYRRFALAAFIAVILVASVSYGLWQSWWLGLMILIAAYVMLCKNTPLAGCK